MIHDSVDSLVIRRGLEILAFPCNQFRAQEPGNNQQIVEFACTRFKAEYPIFDKVADEIHKLLGEEYQDFLRAVLQLTCSDEEHQFSHMRASQSLLGPLRTVRRLHVT